MMTSSNGSIFRVTGLLWGEYTGDRCIHITKASKRGALTFSLMCAWTNRVNSRDAGDLRIHGAHCDDIYVNTEKKIYQSHRPNVVQNFVSEHTGGKWKIHDTKHHKETSNRDLTHPPLNKIAAISQPTFSNAFLWMKNFVFVFKFHWCLFPGNQLTKSQHCVR